MEENLKEEKLADSYNRSINYLRVSVTDRCNQRCIYCMPPEGIKQFDHDQILRYEEILRVIKVLMKKGVTKIRITGGEPLVRKKIIQFIESLGKFRGIKDLALSTNGVFLKDYARNLVRAGLKRVNISLDTLNPRKFYKLARADNFYRVMDGIEEAEKSRLSPIKINMVVIKGFNDDEVIDFALLTKKKSYRVRFIEFMPSLNGGYWTKDNFISNREVFEEINSFQVLYPIVGREKGQPAKKFKFEDGIGEIGFISPVSEPFCHNCNRIRLTADGKLRSCLFSDNEVDIKKALSNGCADNHLSELIDQAIKNKPKNHNLKEHYFTNSKRTMSLIGG